MAELIPFVVVLALWIDRLAVVRVVAPKEGEAVDEDGSDPQSPR